jgi:hypothetical protein
VLRDFRAPEGVAADALDAAGDGEVLVVVDLRSDASLVEAGVAREVVNRWGVGWGEVALFEVDSRRLLDRRAWDVLIRQTGVCRHPAKASCDGKVRQVPGRQSRRG